MNLWVVVKNYLGTCLYINNLKNNKMKKIIFFISLILSSSSFAVMAQNNSDEQLQEAPKTLFPYPQAPDTIKSFQDRANFVIIRFWEKFDLSKHISDEAAFEGAFQDYINFFPHAHKTVVINSIKDLMNKAQSNKANFMLIGRLAEKNMYSPQAIFASDEAYLPFLEAMVRSKIVKKEDREYYKNQIQKINQNMLGSLCPELDVVDVNGVKLKLSSLLSDKTTILFFNDGECSDCMLGRLRLSTNVNLNTLISEGNIKIVCITPKKYSEQWASEARTWAENWSIVASEDADKIFDIRIAPSIFILDAEKKIAEKNILVDMIVR